MAATTTVPPRYLPPEVLPGDLVFWLPGGRLDERPQPAFVTEVGRDALTLGIMQGLVDRFVVRDSVRHVDDPRPRMDEVFVAGAWIGREDYLTRPDVPEQVKASIGHRASEQVIKDRAAQAARDAKKAATAAVA